MPECLQYSGDVVLVQFALFFGGVVMLVDIIPGKLRCDFDGGIAEFFGFQGYHPLFDKNSDLSKKPMKCDPGETEFSEFSPTIDSERLLSSSGANVYRGTEPLVIKKLVVSPFVAVQLFTQGEISPEDLRGAKEVTIGGGNHGIEIEKFLFLDADDGDECYVCTLRIEPRPKYEIYAIGEDGRQIL